MSARGAIARRPLLLAAVLLGALGACGKKGALQPPEERTSEFTYPGIYPAPELVAPDLPPPQREQPPPSGGRGITVFPKGRTTTRTYGPTSGSTPP